MKKYGLILLALSACGNEAVVQNLGDTAPIGGTQGSATDVRAVVSQGNNLSFNNRTGGVNDLATNPITGLPAVAYHDQDLNGGGTGATPASGALKFAYMDSSGNWNVEVVDVSYGNVACGTAGSFCVGAPNAAANVAATIRLAFKSDGTPAIAYSFGASAAGPGDKEIRFAERTAAGAWAIQRAFTSTIGSGAGAVSVTGTINPFSGLTLLFDSADRPHVTVAVYAATLLSSSIKYFFRTSAGAWVTNDITTNSVVGATAALTAATGSLQAGAAWCSAGSASAGSAPAPIYLYQKVRGAGGHGNPLYINCTAVAASGACTAWNVLDLVNGCAGGSCNTASFTTGADNGVVGANVGARADLMIDPATNKPVLGLYSVASTVGNTSLIMSTAPNACNIAQPSTANSWNPFYLVEGSSAGANGFRLAMRNSSNLYATYVLGTTAFRQSRSGNGGLNWFATGHTVETPATALGGQGVGIGYDAVNDLLYTSYATQGAVNAIGNDLRVAYVDPEDLASAGAAGSAHQIDTVDTTGNAFPAPLANAPPLLSAAKAPNGLVGFAYYFHDNNGVFADSKLYYGLRGGSATNPVFSEAFVTNHQESSSATAGVGLSPSLAYDAGSNPVIAFYNGATTDVNLHVARSANGGTSFSLTVVDDTSADTGRFPSLVSFGTSLGIAYRDETNSALKFARWTSAGQWKRYVVDGGAGAGGSGCAVGNASGQYAKLAFTSGGRPVIAYQDDTGASSLLKIAIAAEAVGNAAGTFTWTCLTLDSGSANASGHGEGIGMALDTSDRLHLVHLNFSTGDYRYVTSSVAIGNAISTGAGAFTASILTNVTSPSLAAGNTVPSVQVTPLSTVYVGLHSPQSRALLLAKKESGATAFSLELVEQAPNLGGITTPFSGQYPILLLNSSALPMIFYRSWENWIRYFSREF